MRVRSKWNKSGKKRSIEEIAGAQAFIQWRIAGNTVLNLENEGFETETNAQRLDIFQEICAFLIHVTDRLVHEVLSEEDRQKFIVELALKTADVYHDNRVDAHGRGEDYKKPFIKILNERLADYSEFTFEEGEPGYAFKRYLGEAVTGVMGDRDRKWITDQVMEIEVPEMLTTLKKNMKSLFDTGENPLPDESAKD
ncbi:MAG: hypothetical protein V3W04_00195 [Gammaproteobacteria bacterium]